MTLRIMKSLMDQPPKSRQSVLVSIFVSNLFIPVLNIYTDCPEVTSVSIQFKARSICGLEQYDNFNIRYHLFDDFPGTSNITTLFFKRNAAWKVAFLLGKSVDR